MEASGSQPLDDASLPGIPDQRMLALVNTYIVHTSALLNSFATSCEERLQGVTLRARELGVTLELLEARVDSALASMEAAPALEGAPREGEGAAASGGGALQPNVQSPGSASPSVRGGYASGEDIEEIGIGRPAGGSASPDRGTLERGERTQGSGSGSSGTLPSRTGRPGDSPAATHATGREERAPADIT